VLGEARRTSANEGGQLGQQRVAVSFHRIVMPDGYSVSLDQFQGLNQVGATGLKDKVNHHYMRIFGASLALGAIAGFSLHNTNQGLNQSGMDAYRAGVAQNLGQSGTRILDRFLNILPTLTIREGHRVKIYLSGDLLLPAYDRHQMPSDL
jgi:type IV secretion system protein VirB10